MKRGLLLVTVLLVILAGGCGTVSKGLMWFADNVLGIDGVKDPPEPILLENKTALVASPDETGGNSPDQGEEEQVITPPLITISDPSGFTYEIIDGVVFVSFPNPPEYDPNQGVPVGDVTWLGDQSIQSFLQETGLTLLYDWPALKVILCKLPPGMSVEEAMTSLPVQYPDLVEDVSPDITVEKTFTPNDPYFSNPPPVVYGGGQWYLKNPSYGQSSVFGTNVTSAWDIVKTLPAQSIKAAVMDNGVQYHQNSPDLLPGLDTNGVHIHLNPQTGTVAYSQYGSSGGIPWGSPGYPLYQEGEKWNSAHGTNVASIMRAQVDNALGTAGILWSNWNLYPRLFSFRMDEYRVSVNGYGVYRLETSEELEAWYALAVLKGIYTHQPNRFLAPAGATEPIRVVNASFGSLISHWAFSYPQNPNYRLYASGGRIYKNIRDLYSFGGVLVVASAGNENREISHSTYYRSIPANYDVVLSVGAYDKDGYRSVWRLDVGGNPTSASNYGSWINVSAPGTGVYTLDQTGDTYGEPLSYTSQYPTTVIPRYTQNGFEFETYNNYPGPPPYYHFQGTSAAAPVVSAIAMLGVIKNPSITPAQLRQKLINSALNHPLPPDPIYGIRMPGRVDAWDMMN